MNRLIVLLVLSLLFPGAAWAVTGIDAVMNNIIRSTPGITNIPISGGVRVGTSAAVDVAAGGFTIPVATTVAADVSAASIALGGAKLALRAVPWVGTAIVVGEVANALRNKNVSVCPPPDFFCNTNVPDPGTLAPAIYGFGGSQTTFSSAYAAGIASAEYLRKSNNCNSSSSPSYCPHISVSNTVCTPTATNDCSNVGTSPCTETATSWTCPTDSANYPNLTGGKSADPKGCVAPAVLSGQYCVTAGATLPPSPATVSGLQKQLTDSFNSDASLVAKMKKEMDDVAQQNPNIAPPIDYATAPVVVTSPAVTSPAKVVSTTTIPNADGTTSTQVVSSTTTVTPQIATPATVAVPNVSYPSTTTTTTTTTNNTTNVSTTSVSNVVNQAPPAVDPAKMPTDYNREVTQQSILQKITDFTAPITAVAPTGDKDINAVRDQNLLGTNAVTAIDEGSTGLKAWFPTFATSACVDPTVPTPITGSMIRVPICDKVAIFSSLISAVMCVFALIGCVREVQAALKA